MQTQAGEGTLFRQTPSGLERRQQSRVYGRGSQGANGTESIARKPPCLTRGKGKITTRCGKRPRPGKGPGKGLHEALRLLGLRQDAFQSHRARAPQTGAQNGSGSRGAGGGGSRPQGLLFPKRDRRTERGSGPLVAPGLLRSIRASFLHGVHHGRFLALLGHRAWRAALSQAARGAGNPALQGPGGQSGTQKVCGPCAGIRPSPWTAPHDLPCISGTGRSRSLQTATMTEGERILRV